MHPSMYKAVNPEAKMIVNTTALAKMPGGVKTIAASPSIHIWPHQVFIEGMMKPKRRAQDKSSTAPMTPMRLSGWLKI